MFKNLYLLLTNFIKRIKKYKAHAMKKRPHLRAKIQRVLTMKPDSVSTATSNLFITPIKSLVLDTIRITDHFSIPHPYSLNTMQTSFTAFFSAVF